MASAAGAAGQVAPADSVYLGGNIYTMDAASPRAEALAIAGDRLVAVGSDEEIRRLVGEGTAVHNLGGRTVLPGLIDAHGHIGSLGLFGLGRLDLSTARSMDELVAKVSAAAKKAGAGAWVLGGRWDHESWPGKELPRHGGLSAATSDNPVWLRRVDGHAGLANAAAMRRAGVTRETVSPAGGEIIRDENGEPTGVFVDNAKGLIERVVDAPVPDAAALIDRAQQMCFEVGLTGVHDMGVSPADIEAYRGLAESGRLKLRVYALLSAPYAVAYFEDHDLLIGDRLTVRSAKLYADGAMGSRGAWLLEPYSDRPKGEDGAPYSGLALTDPARIEAVVKHALGRGYQVCTHAIGDRGNRETLDAYERALRQVPASDHRLRVEHAQLLSPADVGRFAGLEVVASMQPTHCTSDMRWVEARVGPQRAKGAYAWASLLRSGAVIAAGSDFPVESHNPFYGLHAAITREDAEGAPGGGWYPEQRMTREEALRAFTLGAAWAGFEEEKKGSLVSGKLADFVVVDRDVMVCEAGDVRGTKVLRTVVGGEVVFESGASGLPRSAVGEPSPSRAHP